jgi:hypothetical protein
MGRTAHYAAPGLLIGHIPESRRRRMARLRILALAVIAGIAATGVALQANEQRRAPGVDIAAAEPRPFDYFPG